MLPTNLRPISNLQLPVRNSRSQLEKDSCTSRTAKIALVIIASLIGFVFLPVKMALLLTTTAAISAVILFAGCLDNSSSPFQNEDIASIIQESVQGIFPRPLNLPQRTSESSQISISELSPSRSSGLLSSPLSCSSLSEDNSPLYSPSESEKNLDRSKFDDAAEQAATPSNDLTIASSSTLTIYPPIGHRLMDSPRTLTPASINHSLNSPINFSESISPLDNPFPTHIAISQLVEKFDNPDQVLKKLDLPSPPSSPSPTFSPSLVISPPISPPIANQSIAPESPRMLSPANIPLKLEESYELLRDPPVSEERSAVPIPTLVLPLMVNCNEPLDIPEVLLTPKHSNLKLDATVENEGDDILVLSPLANDPQADLDGGIYL